MEGEFISIERFEPRMRIHEPILSALCTSHSVRRTRHCARSGISRDTDCTLPTRGWFLHRNCGHHREPLLSNALTNWHEAVAFIAIGGASMAILAAI
jgi:hypothetical protein